MPLRVYLDSMVWIYALEGKERFGEPAQALLRRLRSSSSTLLTSHLLFAELIVPHLRVDDQFTITSYRRMLLQSAATEVALFGESAALKYAELRAVYRVAPPDAMHLAIAGSAQADAFITTDNRLRNISLPGIGSIADLSFGI